MQLCFLAAPSLHCNFDSLDNTLKASTFKAYINWPALFFPSYQRFKNVILIADAVCLEAQSQFSKFIINLTLHTLYNCSNGCLLQVFTCIIEFLIQMIFPAHFSSCTTSQILSFLVLILYNLNDPVVLSSITCKAQTIIVLFTKHNKSLIPSRSILCHFLS